MEQNQSRQACSCPHHFMIPALVILRYGGVVRNKLIKTTLVFF
jgi:hypothetical protein